MHTFIPSSTLTMVLNEDDDSMDKTPSGPTFSVASAIIVPIRSTFLAEKEATAEKYKHEFAIKQIRKRSLFASGR